MSISVASKWVLYSLTPIHVSVLCVNIKHCIHTHVAASPLGIVFHPIREYLRQAFCSLPSPWKGREGSQCARPSSNTIGLPCHQGFPHKHSIFTKSHTRSLGFICLAIICLENALDMFFWEWLRRRTEVKASEPCIPFISVYRKRPSVVPGFEPWKLVQVH